MSRTTPAKYPPCPTLQDEHSLQAVRQEEQGLFHLKEKRQQLQKLISHYNQKNQELEALDSQLARARAAINDNQKDKKEHNRILASLEIQDFQLARLRAEVTELQQLQERRRKQDLPQLVLCVQQKLQQAYSTQSRLQSESSRICLQLQQIKQQQQAVAMKADQSLHHQQNRCNELHRFLQRIYQENQAKEHILQQLNQEVQNWLHHRDQAQRQLKGNEDMIDRLESALQQSSEDLISQKSQSKSCQNHLQRQICDLQVSKQEKLSALQKQHKQLQALRQEEAEFAAIETELLENMRLLQRQIDQARLEDKKKGVQIDALLINKHDVREKLQVMKKRHYELVQSQRNNMQCNQSKKSLNEQISGLRTRIRLQKQSEIKLVDELLKK